MSDNTNTSKEQSKTKISKASLAQLTKKENELKAKLESIKAAKEQKQAALTAKETSQARKKRTHVLILVGENWERDLKNTLKNSTKENIINLTNECCNQIARTYRERAIELENQPPNPKHSPEKAQELLQKNKKTLEKNMYAIIEFIQQTAKNIIK